MHHTAMHHAAMHHATDRSTERVRADRPSGIHRRPRFHFKRWSGGGVARYLGAGETVGNGGVGALE